MRPAARILAGWPVVIALLAAAGCDEDAINPMAARQPRVGYYSASDFYADGMGMRQPPVGTVPRQRITGSSMMTAGKDGTVYATTFPVRIDEQMLRLGQKRFNVICATCHGPLGDGDSIVGRQMSLRPPPSLMEFTNRPVGYLFEVITRGHGLMASYSAELPVPERWAVVAYVRALQISRTASLDKAPLAERNRLEKETP
jgi:mono/diheme cytochrome c family protein